MEINIIKLIDELEKKIRDLRTEIKEKQQFHEHGKDNPPHPSKQMMNRFYRR